ncbi:MAG: GNAT family N-acetyltransferase [Promethearchaeota archaeon]|jgi:ribosomal protein S18 acetylase RimI-like enzyme
MSVELFNIRKYDESIKFSSLVELYNKFARYLNPAAVVINDEYASIILDNDPDFFDNSLIFETMENEIIGFASIFKLPFAKNDRMVIYGLIPEYLESELPGELVDAILNHGIKQNIPELYIDTTGELSKPFDDKLEKLGFKPIHYYFFMDLDEFDLFSPSDIPEGIIIRDQDGFGDTEQLKNIVYVVNEAFKDSFMWEEIKPRKWKRNLEALKKNHIMGFAIAYEEDKIVGFCNGYFNPDQGNTGIINTLSVLPSYHHRGIGSALFASRVEFLRDKGCKIINLAVDAKNERALKLYETFGFYVKKNLTQKTYKLI